MTFLEKYDSLPKEQKIVYKMEIEYQVTTKKLLKAAITTDEVRTVEFTTCMACNMKRIVSAALLLPDELFGVKLKDIALPQINNNLDKLIYIVAAGIQNNSKEPEPELIDFVKNNFDHEQLLEGFNYTINQLGMQSFVGCLVIARGSKILKGEDQKLPAHEIHKEGNTANGH